MKLVVFAWFAGALVATGALAEDSPDAPKMVYVAGYWSYPGGDLMLANYPERARKAHVAGEGTVDCLVAADGTLSSCDIVSETPEGYGFGRATAELLLQYAHVKPSSVEGGLQPDSRKKMTYRWSLPRGE